VTSTVQRSDKRRRDSNTGSNPVSGNDGVSRGVTAQIVMALGGWKTERMMRRYAAVTNQTLQAATEAVSDPGLGPCDTPLFYARYGSRTLRHRDVRRGASSPVHYSINLASSRADCFLRSGTHVTDPSSGRRTSARTRAATNSRNSLDLEIDRCP